ILYSVLIIFSFTDTSTPDIYTLSLHDALPIWILQTKKFYYSLDDTKRKLLDEVGDGFINFVKGLAIALSAKTLFSATTGIMNLRSEEHTSELQSRFDLVCRLLLEKKKKNNRK